VQIKISKKQVVIHTNLALRFVAGCCHVANLIVSGCLQLLEILEILEISWNLKTLLEILEISWNLNGPPGNFCVMIEN